MTAVVWSDIGWVWATLAGWRRHEACRRAGVPAERDDRALPLELLRSRCAPKQVLDAEMPVLGSLAANPGVEVHGEGEPGRGGYPVVDAGDSSVYDELVASVSSS